MHNDLLSSGGDLPAATGLKDKQTCWVLITESGKCMTQVERGRAEIE